MQRKIPNKACSFYVSVAYGKLMVTGEICPHITKYINNNILVCLLFDGKGFYSMLKKFLIIVTFEFIMHVYCYQSFLNFTSKTFYDQKSDIITFFAKTFIETNTVLEKCKLGMRRINLSCRILLARI
jgi:hypothetical protein